MSVKISGVMKDAMGKPIPDCTIALKALHTTATVITKTVGSLQPEENGSYSMDVELGKYSVTLCVEGYPPNDVGEIYVHSESAPGTLNYYLGLPTEGDLPPAAIQQFEAMVELVSQQAAQVEKDKAAADVSAKAAKLSETNAKTSETNAGKSAAAALVSEKAAKTSETNTAKGIEAAAASAQAAKLSENNADGSKKAAQASAAEALASQGDAKTSETNAGNSAKAASGSADKAKSEADRATTATDGKQDKNALLTAIAALNTAADQIITLTGKNSVATAVLTKFAKEMLAKTDAGGIREYLGLKEALKIGDFGVGAVNPPLITNNVTEKTGLYSALTDNNELGTAWSIQGQAVGMINLGMHHSNSNAFKSQIATSYGSSGRVFYRCSLDGVWKAWKEVATTGVAGFELGNNSKIVGVSGQTGFQIQNRARAENDPSSSLTIAIPIGVNERPFLYQSPRSSNEGAILSRLPSVSGDLLAGNVTPKNMVNQNFNNHSLTSFDTFISGGTTHGAMNGPNVGYGNLLTFGVNTAATGQYCTQIVTDKTNAATYIRCRGDGSTPVWTGWQKVTVAPVSDENMKDIRGNLNVEGALDNVNRMEFKIFAFIGDESQRFRRGVISQQIKKIDKDYVSLVADHLCLDPTPMLLDGLAAIKALRARDEENKKRIYKLEGEVEQLKLLVASLIEKPAEMHEIS
ncbi:prophage tail fiber N-terminal domain-containing protein [Hafnia alvei]|uniref:prophage tail fiber N-terminal domain-containing protein n=1 Tax=Hafnia alvei TaxID=569 RepID=UPI00069B3F70|nr:prophage tail fiber N-terminal domain-containing protein [Hafnia alvei]